MHLACIRTHLISSASAVSLVSRPEDRTRLLSSSLRLFSGSTQLPVAFLYRNAGRRLGTRLHQSHETTSAAARAAHLAFSYVLGVLSLCCFLLCCFVHVTACCCSSLLHAMHCLLRLTPQCNSFCWLSEKSNQHALSSCHHTVLVYVFQESHFTLVQP